MSILVTPHFALSEFDCHDGQSVPEVYRPNLDRLCIGVLEPVRERWGKPIIIISGWRSKSWNAKVGGAPGSRHLKAEAGDIRTVQVMDLPELRALIEDMIADDELPALGGIGYYPNRWLHVDVRPHAPLRLARWDGKGVGSERA